MKPSSSRSLSTYEFTIGYSVIAIEQALMKKGSMVSLGCYFFISFLKAISLVALISSDSVKNGIESDSVIVFVIAFFMPVMCLTLNNKRLRFYNETYSSSSVMPVKGAI
jgi:hypothetical protein